MTLRIESSATKSSGANVVIIPASAGFSKKNDTSYFGQYLVWFGLVEVHSQINNVARPSNQ